MKRSRYTEEQIIGILKEQEAGASVGELCRKHGMSEATFYNWKSKCGGLERLLEILGQARRAVAAIAIVDAVLARQPGEYDAERAQLDGRKLEGGNEIGHRGAGLPARIRDSTGSRAVNSARHAHATRCAWLRAALRSACGREFDDALGPK
jgi:Transposase